MRFRPKPLAVVIFALATTFCAPPDLPPLPDTRGADLLWVPANAVLTEDWASPVIVKNGRSVYVDSTSAVGFSVNSDREDLSAEVVRHFAAMEWRPRDRQSRNPQNSTSFEEGWQGRCACVIQMDSEGKVIPQETFYEWHGEWENTRGDVVTYRLAGQGRQLRGYGTFDPAVQAAKP